jgi:hypothetical protein
MSAHAVGQRQKIVWAVGGYHPDRPLITTNLANSPVHIIVLVANSPVCIIVPVQYQIHRLHKKGENNANTPQTKIFLLDNMFSI